MAKLSIDKESLVAISDALRAHFGDVAQEGTTVFQEEAPKIIKTPNYDDFSTSENNGEWMAAVGGIDNTFVNTIKIHGASKIVLNLAYRTGVDLTTTGYEKDWLWLAEGAYRYVEPNKGKKLQYNELYRWHCPSCGALVKGTGIMLQVGEPVAGPGIIEFEDKHHRELHVCEQCGIEGFCYPYTSDPTGPADPSFSGYICTDLTLPYEFEFIPESGAWRTIDTFTLNGDIFTFATHISDRTQETGYYGEIYAYDADGNELDCYEVTTGYLPNVYTPDPGLSTPNTMAWAISKLNNYPNGEEVQF